MGGIEHGRDQTRRDISSWKNKVEMCQGLRKQSV